MLEEKTAGIPKENEPEIAARRVAMGAQDVNNSYDPQHMLSDDENLLAKNVAPMYIHDRTNPTIEEKATFADCKTFKIALRQLAIREEWSFDIEHSDPTRFRARCLDDECQWRIHASKLKRCNTSWHVSV